MNRPKEFPVKESITERIYENIGNPQLIDLLPDFKSLLDIGCGAGDNARLIRSINHNCEIHGITYSEAEATIASRFVNKCWCFNLEAAIPDDLLEHRFDVLMFSHVLEHLRDPADVVSRYSHLLAPGGSVLIAVPNVLSWRMRLQFLAGRFEYESAGVLDDTHLRFFTFFTTDRFLLAQSPELKVVSKTATGSVPLWWLRRHLLPQSWSDRIDQWGCRHWPNLFGGQILIKAVKQ